MGKGETKQSRANLLEVYISATGSSLSSNNEHMLPFPGTTSGCINPSDCTSLSLIKGPVEFHCRRNA